MKAQIFEKLNSISEDHDVDVEDVIDFINDQEMKIEKLGDKIDDLKEEIDVLEEQVQEKSNCFEYPQGFNDNIVVVGVLEDLFSNLDRIPIDKLENFIKQYSV